MVVSLFFLGSYIINATTTYHKIIEGDVKSLCIFSCAVFIIVVWSFILLLVRKGDYYEQQIEKKDTLMLLKEKQYSKEKKLIQDDYEKQISFLKNINHELRDLIKTKTPFKDVAIIYADYETAIYEKDERFLRYKPRPAIKAADKLKELRGILQNNIQDYKQMLYKYEFLFSVFPELKTYFEDEEELVHITDYSLNEDFNADRDKVRDWISDDEYKRLSVDERNQLALDKYKKRRKSNWEIGIEYELYIGYLLREGKSPFNKKFNVVQFGEKHGLNDLGRDIIAKEIEHNGKTYIIQCKRWSETRVVHENAICQLYGTAVAYRINHKELSANIIPMFVTTTDLSEMAKEFAKQLGVHVIKIPIGDFPMIKCNINNGERIYHLPFDQQYHRAEIKNEGEFYAMTVKDATSKGFRRAIRHLFN